MRTPCTYDPGSGRGDGRAGRPMAAHRQVCLIIEVEDHPRVALAAARLLVVATDDLREDGFVICQVRLAVEA